MTLKSSISASDYLNVSRVKGVRKWRVTVNELEWTDWRETKTSAVDEVHSVAYGAAYDLVTANAQPGDGGVYNWSMAEDVRAANSYLITRNYEKTVQESFVTSPTILAPTYTAVLNTGASISAYTAGSFSDGLRDLSAAQQNMPFNTNATVTITNPNSSGNLHFVVERSTNPADRFYVMTVQSWRVYLTGSSSSKTRVFTLPQNDTCKNHAVRTYVGGTHTVWRFKAWVEITANDGTKYTNYMPSDNSWLYIYASNSWNNNCTWDP